MKHKDVSGGSFSKKLLKKAVFLKTGNIQEIPVFISDQFSNAPYGTRAMASRHFT
ncbi:hypothetical protein SXCC_04649 [Gluconacetobacter sp. SXCC-1]|nr:hypothetical protein SXCC_04649 [Gluconacetobacter sp. SXCC-1]